MNGAPETDLFEDAPCGYAVTDAHGTVLAANAELHRLTATPAGRLVGRPLSSLLTVGGRIYLETHLQPMLAHDAEVREVSLDLVRDDGSRIPVLMNATVAAGDGSVRAVFMETRDRYRYEQDLLAATRAAERARAEATALAQTLQRTLVPPAPPSIPHLAVAATYRPAGDGSEVGGDFYDIFQLGPSRWVVVLGDVSGKGVAAAAVTSFVRYTIRALAVRHDDPSEVLRELDRAVDAHSTDHYCTLVVAHLTEAGGAWTVRLALGGHPPPLLVGADGGIRELGAYGTAVGLVDDARFHTVEHRLGEQETVFLYTDGVTEARSGGEMYGDGRLLDLLARTPGTPEQVTHAVAESVMAFQGARASDDIAVLAFAAAGPPAR